MDKKIVHHMYCNEKESIGSITRSGQVQKLVSATGETLCGHQMTVTGSSRLKTRKIDVSKNPSRCRMFTNL